MRSRLQALLSIFGGFWSRVTPVRIVQTKTLRSSIILVKRMVMSRLLPGLRL